jgi:hypothetical protein
VAGSCEYGNEPSGSIKCGEYFDELLNYKTGKFPVLWFRSPHRPEDGSLSIAETCRLKLLL